jgi:hypothetical protein
MIFKKCKDVLMNLVQLSSQIESLNQAAHSHLLFFLRKHGIKFSKSRQRGKKYLLFDLSQIPDKLLTEISEFVQLNLETCLTDVLNKSHQERQEQLDYYKQILNNDTAATATATATSSSSFVPFSREVLDMTMFSKVIIDTLYESIQCNDSKLSFSIPLLSKTQIFDIIQVYCDPQHTAGSTGQYKSTKKYPPVFDRLYKKIKQLDRKTSTSGSHVTYFEGNDEDRSDNTTMDNAMMDNVMMNNVMDNAMDNVMNSVIDNNGDDHIEVVDDDLLHHDDCEDDKDDMIEMDIEYSEEFTARDEDEVDLEDDPPIVDESSQTIYEQLNLTDIDVNILNQYKRKCEKLGIKFIDSDKLVYNKMILF